MVPLRQIAEALHFNTTFSPDGKSIQLEREPFHTTFLHSKKAETSEAGGTIYNKNLMQLPT